MPGSVAGLIQSPCSRQTTFMRVSPRLQANAAPEAPAPTMRTSAVVSGINGSPGPAYSTFGTLPARRTDNRWDWCRPGDRETRGGGARRPAVGRIERRGRQLSIRRREFLAYACRFATAAVAGGPLLALARVRPARAGTPIAKLRRAIAAADGTVL